MYNTDSDNGKRNIRAFSKFLNAHGITAKRLRKIGSKHASRVHGSQNPMPQHLSLLCRIAMRHKIDCFDSGTYYAEGDTSDSDTNPDKNNDLSKECPSPNCDKDVEIFEEFSRRDSTLSGVSSVTARMEKELQVNSTGNSQDNERMDIEYESEDENNTFQTQASTQERS
nr:4190_t:CDS:2 [Entrophospora candida]